MAADLSNVRLFQGVAPEALRALGEKCSTRDVARDGVIIHEGDLPDSLYVILKGRVRVFLTDEKSRELVLTTKGPGEYFGEMMLDDRPRSASVAAQEPCELGLIPRAAFTGFLSEQPQVALQLIRDLIRMGRGMNVRTREELSAREKLRAYAADLESRSVYDAPSVRRWEYAKRAVLALLLTFAVLQFYFSDVFIRMMSLGGTLVFTAH